VLGIRFQVKKKRRILFLTLVTNTFSKRITEYHLLEHLRTYGQLKAQYMFIEIVATQAKDLMHHIDHGFQLK